MVVIGSAKLYNYIGTKKGDTKGGGGLGFSVTLTLTVVNLNRKPPN